MARNKGGKQNNNSFVSLTCGDCGTQTTKRKTLEVVNDKGAKRRVCRTHLPAKERPILPPYSENPNLPSRFISDPNKLGMARTG